MIKKKILVRRIKIILDLSKVYKSQILEIENKKKSLGLPEMVHTSFINRYIDEIIRILEGTRTKREEDSA